MSEPSTPTHSAPPSPRTPVTPAAQATPLLPPPLLHPGGEVVHGVPEDMEAIPILWFDPVPSTPGSMPVLLGEAPSRVRRNLMDELNEDS
jgi:hypothetical protein